MVTDNYFVYDVTGVVMELVGLAEIAALFGTTKQVVSNWRTRKPRFPAATAELKAGPVWSRDDIVRWAKREGIPLADMKSNTGSRKPFNRTAISVAIMNMKGGVGKSTLAANLGWYAAHEQNKRVLMVDLDPQFNLSQYLLGVQEYELLLAENKFTVEALFCEPDTRPSSVKDVIMSVVDYDDDSCVHLIPASLELAWTIKTAVQRAHVLRDYLSEVKDE
jgi:chromosome partitioning protein